MKYAEAINERRLFLMGEKSIEENKKLVAQMPFLKPLCRRNGKTLDEYDYSYTELDAAEIPRGWNALFYNYCLEITPILAKANELNDFSFLQVKEKWGELRIYYSGVNHEVAVKIDAVEKKYVEMSKKTCCLCGKTGKMTYDGWVCPYCKECWETKRQSNLSYEDAIKCNYE